MQGARVVDVDRQGSDLEHAVAVFEAEDVPVGPEAQPAVLRQAVAPDPRAGEDDVAVGGPHLDGLDDLDEVHTVALCEQAPFVQVREDRRPVGILDDLGGLRFDGAVHDREGEIFRVQHLFEERHDPFPGFAVAAGADPPEVADARNVVLPRHHPLETVGKERRGCDAALGKRFLEDRPGDEFGGARGDRGFDQHQAGGSYLLPDSAHGRLERCHVGLAAAHVAEGVLAIVALHVDHNAVGKGKAIAVVRGDQGLLLQHAARDEFVHLRVFRLDGRLPPVEQGDFPIAPAAGPLAADDEFAGTPRFIFGVCDDCGHDGADEPHAHHHDHFFPFSPRTFSQLPDATEFLPVICLAGKGELFAGRADRQLCTGLGHFRQLFPGHLQRPPEGVMGSHGNTILNYS